MTTQVIRWAGLAVLALAELWLMLAGVAALRGLIEVLCSGRCSIG